MKYNNESQELKNVKAIEKIIGYTFNDIQFLQRAITHVSYNKMMGKGGDSYQRMEYLGDAILDFVVADEFAKCPF